MKTFLTIRGNLLLINVFVVGLILWLAVSFLFIAAAQRKEAILLQKSMSVERVISQIGEALANERQVYSDYLNSRESASVQQREQVQQVSKTTDAELDAMTQQIASLIAQAGFVKKIPASRSSVQQLLDSLSAHRVLLDEQRKHAITQGAMSSTSRDTYALASLHHSQSNLQEHLVSLAKSLKYLPDFDAASIEIYYSLLNEILIANIELARKHTMLGSVPSGGQPNIPVSRFQLTELNNRIAQHFEDILRLANASEKQAQLSPLAVSVQEFYLQEYRELEREIDRMAVSSKWEPKRQFDWQVATSNLTQLIDDLAAETHQAIEQLAIKSAERATRNLYIDIFLVILCFVITSASVLINRRVKRFAYHDGLTRLANRMNFESALKEVTVTGSQSHAVIFLDLDRFKSINDNYGHAIGDELLVEVAARLSAICKPSDLLARLGGDEFAVLMLDIESQAAVEAVACQMVETIERVITIRDLNLKVGASAGISIAPEDSEGGVELLKNADIAMYHTKSNKLGNVFRFNQSIAVRYQQRLALEQDLKKGLENEEFQLVYQPKVCTSTGQVKSVEALLRWLHPTRGLVSPVQFIPVAEETGLMGHIGYWALNEACRELSQLQNSDVPNIQVAVNISPQQFGDEHFVERVCSAIKTHGLNYSSLSLEVTESIVMNDVERVIQMLKSLQALGIDIAVDDFGTGYSSLQYLQELPLNTLKIDRAFITALDHSGADCSVANLIVQLAALFNLETVAEGVETLEQEEKVRALGVNHIQGYLYSRPVSAAELPAVIKAIDEQFQFADCNRHNRAA